MRVMVLVKATNESEAGIMPATELIEAMGAYNEELVKAGIMLAADGLKPSSAGVRIEFEGVSGRTVVDGPFAETKELLAGFWIWQVKDLAEAIEWARRCPNPHGDGGTLEIRPVWEAEDWKDVVPPEVLEQEQRLREQLEGQQR